MKKCTYCGREGEDFLVRCRECGSELAAAPGTVANPTTPSRYPLVVGLLLGGAGGFWLLLVTGARIDSPEEFDMALRLALSYAAPLALGAMFLAVDLSRRWKRAPRIAFALLVCGTVWLLGWQFQVHAHYSQLRTRGVDPDQVLRRSKLKSALPNPRPALDAVFAFSLPFGRHWHRASEVGLAEVYKL